MMALEKIEKIKYKYESVSSGIGHTRWATHGEKNDTNSHPHTSSDNLFSIVHNGIIENYLPLKNMLIEAGYNFKSQTDSEVIANLLSFHYSKNKFSVIDTIKNTIEQLQGTWGLAILCLDTPDKLYCTRHGSPLLVSHCDSYALISSEKTGFISNSDYIILNSNDICSIEYNVNEKKVHIFTQEEYTVNKSIYTETALSPAPYPHWMLKEIMEQKESTLRSIGGRLTKNAKIVLGGLNTEKKRIIETQNLILLGCGTSFHSALLCSHYFKEICDFNTVLIFDAAEFTEKDIPAIGKTTAILLSQSGETADLYACLPIIKKNNILSIGVVNVVDSLIAREVDCGSYLNAGKEFAVASTKSFTSQVIVLSMIAIWISQEKNIHFVKRKQYIEDLQTLNRDIIATIDKSEIEMEHFLSLFTDKKSCFILGKGLSESVAKEGSLKIKEVSYIHSEAYSSSSLKHGPFALLESNFPVILIQPKDEYYSKNESVYHEITSRNANVMTITNHPEHDKPNTFLIPCSNKTFASLLAIIPIQFLSYKLAISYNYNPDMPRNLAKVVSV
jgi:glucosamine--fructose-6-phosphate aminotransferase (isomerizing)